MGKSMSNEVLITFHFTSGKTMDVTYSKAKFLELMGYVREGSFGFWSVGDDFGINFSQVTHYESSEFKEKQ